MKRDVLVVAHSHFPDDPRIRKEVDALLAAGETVDVVCLRGPGEAAHEVAEGLWIHRLPVARHRDAGLPTYLLEYAAFFLMAAVLVPWLWLRGRHRVVQTHTLPDPLVFVGLVPRLLGARLVLDMHELTPEFFASRIGLGPRHPVIRLLTAAERVSCRVATDVITVSEPVAERLVRRGVPRSKITIVMNTAPAGEGGTGREGSVSAAGAEVVSQEDDRPAAGDAPFVLIYAGLVSDLYDLHTALHALARLRDDGHDGIVLHVVGDGPALAGLREAVDHLRLDPQVSFHGRVPPDRVPALLGEADAALVPLKDVGYMEFALPTKLFEGVAAGLPVITTPFRTVRHYFDDAAVRYAPAGDADALARRILELRDDPALRRAVARHGREVCQAIAWERQAERYRAVMRRGGPDSAGGGR